MVSLVAWNFSIEKTSEKLSDLAVENVEALAGCEVSGWIDGSYKVTWYYDCNWSCYSGGVMDCPY